MPPTVYSGSLQPKKKSELQEIALALKISDQGTKEEVVQRITKHLDVNQDALEDKPMFSGLYGRRRRSVQPQIIPPSRFAQPNTKEIPEKPRSSRPTVLESINETTPVKDLRHVSTLLKQTMSPIESTTPSPTTLQEPFAGDTPIAETIVSYVPAPAKSFIERIPKASEVTAAVQQFGHKEIQNGNQLLVNLRYFLSNSRNIWSVTTLIEMFYILATVIPWKTFEVPLSSQVDGPIYHLRYPPLGAFQTSTLWLVLLHWAIPTIFLPAFIGCIISFNPALAPNKSHQDNAPVAPLDPLTAAIIRLAAQFGYPYTSIAVKSDIVGLDVLGSNVRILSASVGLAFAFAEAISSAPQALAGRLSDDRSLVSSQRRSSYQEVDLSATPTRRAITSSGEPDEID
ncbi:hypothetical protein CPB83DRAFT_795487 [Crepidotus variabilis]|uniref:SAP domain-containing protein n=1 Tax=Crepidotus variabilis TaxID=179855 RepID=A0A9P6EC43_9AGAR|nr:hypothetical protein CPB83DRAFT_795487 [Crepidotus variabilis]